METVKSKDVSKKPAGWWYWKKSNCSICGEKGKLVPEEGHVLSKHLEWNQFKAKIKEKFYYCSHGCLDGESSKDVIKRMREEREWLLERYVDKVSQGVSESKQKITGIVLQLMQHELKGE